MKACRLPALEILAGMALRSSRGLYPGWEMNRDMLLVEEDGAETLIAVVKWLYCGGGR